MIFEKQERFAAAVLPGFNHEDILSRFEMQKFVKHIVTTCDNNGGVVLEVWSKFVVEDTGLDLVGDEDENDCWEKYSGNLSLIKHKGRMHTYHQL